MLDTVPCDRKPLYLAVLKKHNDVTMVAYRWVDENDQQQQLAEWEANWFAAAFLMPRERFMRAYLASEIEDVAKLFAVSVHAASLRAKSLSLVK
ncbi:MAG: ImmA/IrrE family metallo-endopeptidase [Alphaproteobacteria bacterium]|nr:ImmA/IrrE family metallo-endopeptidase [Alphaproteobacteria bacterium]